MLNGPHAYVEFPEIEESTRFEKMRTTDWKLFSAVCDHKSLELSDTLLAGTVCAGRGGEGRQLGTEATGWLKEMELWKKASILLPTPVNAFAAQSRLSWTKTDAMWNWLLSCSPRESRESSFCTTELLGLSTKDYGSSKNLSGWQRSVAK